MHDNIKTATWWTLTSGQNIGCMRHEVEKKKSLTQKLSVRVRKFEKLYESLFVFKYCKRLYSLRKKLAEGFYHYCIHQVSPMG